MRAMILAVATVVTSFAASAALAQNADKMRPGDDLPKIAAPLKNANGDNTTLQGAMKENGLLVMFSCNTCPVVVKNQPVTGKVIQYAATHKVGMVIINSNEAKRGDDDSYDAMKKYAKAQGYTVPYLVDNNSSLADMFGANHTPEVFLFNKKGQLVYKGAMNENPMDPSASKKMYVEEAIDATIAGKVPDPGVTKSVGCSIKRKA